MSINKRVMYIVDRMANSRAEFSRKTGISAVVLSHISSGRNKVSLGTVESILKAYPQLNAEYLILNKGHYLKNAGSDKEDRIREILNQIRQSSDLHHRSVIAHLNQALDELK